MSKILLLFPDLPSKSKAAGHKSSFKTIEELSCLGHDLYLISFDSTGIINSDKQTLEKLCKVVIIIPISNKLKFKNIVLNFFYPVFLATRICKVFKSHIENYIDDCDFVHIEYSQLLFYAKYIKKRFSEKKVIFYSHDILSQKYHRVYVNSIFLKPIFYFYYKIISHFEKKLLSLCDKVIVYNKKDALLLSYIDFKVQCIPLYINMATIPSINKFNRIVFFGAMNRSENIDAVLSFIKFIWIGFNNDHPAVNLTIVGSSPPLSIKKFNNQYNINITGKVDDPYSIISSSLLMVAPIRYGAGVKVKVLESLCCGCPVVALPAGSEGIELGPSDGLITVENYTEMLTSIKLIINKKLTFNSQEISNKIRSLYNWNKSIDYFKKEYK